jgi:hypothetical protein
MKDDELEVWRRQWHSQPAVPIDLIRKVERQTVYMKLQRFALILPVLIGIATVVAAILLKTAPVILLAVGVWVFIILGLVFQYQNEKGVWSPAAETTSAYLELSIARCRKKLNDIRYTFVFAPLLTLFVLVVDYQILASYGVLRTTGDLKKVAAGFLFAIGVVGVVMLLMLATRKKVKQELDYLLNLQRQLEEDGKFDTLPR